MKESRDKNIRLRELLRVANATTVETLKKLQDAEQRHKEGLEEHSGQASVCVQNPRQNTPGSDYEKRGGRNKVMTEKDQDARKVYAPSGAGSPSTIVSTTTSSTGNGSDKELSYNEAVSLLRAVFSSRCSTHGH